MAHRTKGRLCLLYGGGAAVTHCCMCMHGWDKLKSVQMNCLLASKQTYITFTLAWLRTCAGVLGVACQQLHPRAGSAGEALANAEQSVSSTTPAAILPPTP